MRIGLGVVLYVKCKDCKEESKIKPHHSHRTGRRGPKTVTLNSIKGSIGNDCKCKCNLFTHGAPRSSQELVQKCPCILDRIGIWKCWFLRRGENRSTRRKTSRSRVENQQQTQPTYQAGSRNRTRATLVGGERSHHCTIPAPLLLLPFLFQILHF